MNNKPTRISILLILFHLLVLIILGSGCQINFSKPRARHGAVMVYDPVGKRAILFGGRGNGGVSGDLFDDLWALDLDKQRWKKIDASSGPAPRLSPGLVYDPSRHQLILFGGYSNQGRVNDTWLFDINSSEWEELSPAQNPPARSDMGMAYDETNQIVVLYGGYCLEHQRDYCDDTWVFDPASQSWSEQFPETSPPVMYGLTLNFDPESDQFLLWGGHKSEFSREGMSSAGYNDSIWTYSYPDNQWQEIPPGVRSRPAARYWHQATYDSGYPGLFIFGGDSGYGYKDDVWFFDPITASWDRQRSDLTPPARIVGSAVYSPDYGQVILFGGLDNDFSNLNDTWIYSDLSGKWQEITR